MANLTLTPGYAAADRTQEIDDPGRGHAVWKKVLSPYAAEESCLLMPEPAELLSFDWEGENAVIFVRVAPGCAYRERRLLIVQTSREGIPAGARYCGTTRNGAGCAFHLFELPSRPSAGRLDRAA